MFRYTWLVCIFGLICSQVSAFPEQAVEAIVGGDHAKHGKLKYQVSLQLMGDNFCGGAILDDLHILTAAHCVKNEYGKIRMHPYEVVAGTHDLKHHGISRHVVSVFAHKEYNTHPPKNDIAILQLNKPLGLHEHSHSVEKINLPGADHNYDGIDAVISGFGWVEVKLEKYKNRHEIEVGGHSDNKLKYAHVKIISHDRCVEINKPQPIFQTMICGQAHQRHKGQHEGACDGDSGSPLVHGHEVIGILSSSPIGCNESQRASTYTRVASYLGLIHSVLNGNPSNELDFAIVPHHT